MKRHLSVALTLLALASCGSDTIEPENGSEVTRSLEIVIPPEFPTVEAGTLYLTLWSYDPSIADAPATLIAVQSTPFRHTGAAQRRTLTVSGALNEGWSHYLTVDACRTTTANPGSVGWGYVPSENRTQSSVVLEPRQIVSPCAPA